jgi:Astacin (Peptidase family M12A)
MVNDRTRRLLTELRQLIKDIYIELGSTDNDDVPTTKESESEETPSCSIKLLPNKIKIRAAETAVRLNPANAPQMSALSTVGFDVSTLDPLKISVMTTKYWGPKKRTLTVSFMESAPKRFRNRVIEHMNAWNKYCGISFAYVAREGNIRITREDSGYWSYVGTDILHIDLNSPTMCLQDFTYDTVIPEYRRVVRHETGHTLGFPHEHMRKELVLRLDREKCYEYFRRTQGWSQSDVDAQVLTPLNRDSIFGTPADQTSIMCYQLPGSITIDGKPILGGVDINSTDAAFAGKIYPNGNRNESGSAHYSHEPEEADDTSMASEEDDEMTGFTAQANDLA